MFSRMDKDFKKEIKVAIESVTHCGGSCMGCVLSDIERRVVDNQFDLRKITRFVKGYLSDFSKEVRPDEIQIAMGQADHFLLQDGKEDEIVKWIAQLLPGAPVVASITVAAIGKPTRISRKVGLWREAVDKYSQPVNIDLVFDPAKVEVDKFFENYQENFKIIKDAFGDVDLNINIGPDTLKSLYPEKLIDLVKDNGYRRLTLNLTPTADKQTMFRDSAPDIAKFLCDIGIKWDFENGFNLNFIPSIAIYMEDELKGTEDPNNVLRRLENRLCHEIYITNDYKVTNVQSGFGDIALSHRHGFNNVWSIDEIESPLEAVKSISKRNMLAISSKMLRRGACSQCRHIHTCLQTGGAIIAKNIEATESCPTGLLPVMDDIEKIVAFNKDMSSPSYHNKKIDVPAFSPRTKASSLCLRTLGNYL